MLVGAGSQNLSQQAAEWDLSGSVIKANRRNHLVSKAIRLELFETMSKMQKILLEKQNDAIKAG